jgi:hypothetical protein
MRRHGERVVYHILGEDEIVDMLFSPSASGCPFSRTAAAAAPAPASAQKVEFRFIRLFDANPCDKCSWDKLAELGKAMNPDPLEKVTMVDGVTASDDSDIPSGYSYLGQFIAHEITFDSTKGLQEVTDPVESLRSPSFDLDSLYGGGPDDAQSSKMYDGDLLKVGETTPEDFKERLPNDLPREPKTENGKTRYEALIGDERNDENLLLAQTHLAFIKFHNKIVRYLKDNPDKQTPGQSLFEQAKRKVVRHFQWIVLKDFLPKIIDPTVLKSVFEDEDRRLKKLDVASKDDLCIPLEFSAAAFRLGHSMVRRKYQYNHFHRNPPASLLDFFTLTQFGGDLLSLKSLRSDWVIDWRRFYDFPGNDHLDYNRAKKIDTTFNLNLEIISDFPVENVNEKYKALPIRNLIRGCILKLPTGQAVAKALGEIPMLPDVVAGGPNKNITDVLIKNHFDENTPLWFYILREAEKDGGNHLGPVGSRIVAETLYCIVKYSDYSIIREPLLGDEMLKGRETDRFDMVDMLTFTENINPTGKT